MLFALAMAVAACDREDSQTFAPVRRVADERARAAGQREPAALRLGEVTRYVLGPAVIPAVTSLMRTSNDAGLVEIDVLCPSSLAGKDAMISIESIPFGGTPPAAGTPGIRHLQQIIACPGEDGQPTRLTIGARDGAGDARVTYVVAALPNSKQVIDLPDVPPAGQLRAAVGVRRLGTPDAGATVAASLHAEMADGTDLTLWREHLPIPAADGVEEWREISVPLEAARLKSEGSLRLTFDGEAKHTDKYDALVAWGDPTVWAPSTDRMIPHWNVIVVSLDTLRADRLGTYGYPLPITPVLDGFARQGTVFERAVTQATWTLPSHATMLTGTYPCVHQAGMAPGQERVVPRPLPVGIRPLAELLREAGYATVAFTEDALVDPITFQRGFSSFLADRRGGDTKNPPAIKDTVDAAVKWLAEHSHERFFLFLHTYEVHIPYEPPASFATRIPTPLPLPPGGLPPSQALRQDAALYVGEVAYTDASLAPLFTALDGLNLSGRTIVLVTSDHGEAFGEHGNKLHGYSLFEEEIWVPMLWRAPGLIATGRRVGGLVGLVDVVPTILDLLGLPTPRWMQGRSLAAELRPEGSLLEPIDRVLPLSGYTTTGIRGRTWKAIDGRDHYRFMDLASDPQENRALPGNHQQVDEAKHRLKEECATGEVLRGHTADGPLPPSFDPDRDRKLRALGYLE